MVVLHKIVLHLAVRMVHLDGLFFRLIPSDGRIDHPENHGDVRKNQERGQQNHRDACQQVRENGYRINPCPEFAIGRNRQNDNRKPATP